MTPDAVAAYYDKNKAQFMTPETVSLQYLRLDLAAIAANVQVTEEGLRKYYEETAARNETPERRKASHILVESGTTMRPRRRRPRTSSPGPSPARTSPRSRASIRTTSAPRRPAGTWAGRRAKPTSRILGRAVRPAEAGRHRRPVRTQFGIT